MFFCFFVCVCVTVCDHFSLTRVPRRSSCRMPAKVSFPSVSTRVCKSALLHRCASNTYFLHTHFLSLLSQSHWALLPVYVVVVVVVATSSVCWLQRPLAGSIFCCETFLTRGPVIISGSSSFVFRCLLLLILVTSVWLKVLLVSSCFVLFLDFRCLLLSFQIYDFWCLLFFCFWRGWKVSLILLLAYI